MEEKKVTDQIVLTVGYDIESLKEPEIRRKYKGKVTTDYYGRQVPEHAHGSANLDGFTSLSGEIIEAALSIFDGNINENLLVRRVTIVANHVLSEEDAKEKEAESYEQLSLFEDYSQKESQKEAKKKQNEKLRALQEATLKIQQRYGKNAIIKGTSMEEGATGMDRNKQIGGHKA